MAIGRVGHEHQGTARLYAAGGDTHRVSEAADAPTSGKGLARSSGTSHHNHLETAATMEKENGGGRGEKGSGRMGAGEGEREPGVKGTETKVEDTLFNSKKSILVPVSWDKKAERYMWRRPLERRNILPCARFRQPT